MMIAVCLASLAGCAGSRTIVRPREAVAAKPATPKFGELITVPGTFVSKNPPSEGATTEMALFPTRAETAKPETISTLLTPTPASDPPLVAAMRDYAEGKTEKAIERIKDLAPANQELILRLMPALLHASRADLSGRSPTDAAVLGSQLEAAAEATAKHAAMRIRKACFVWRVAQFGVYDPVPEKHPFLPGGSGQLYLELQHAPSTPVATIPAGGSGYVTRLDCSYRILGRDGQPIGPVKAQPQPHTEYMRSPVKDYFLKFEFEVPQEPGAYTLFVELKDPATSRKVCHSSEVIVAPR